MDSESTTANQTSVRLVIDPPTFLPTVDMRKAYLERRKAEVPAMLDSGQAAEWKPVVTIANHVRGTGAMYMFANIGAAAETLARAIQNGDSKCLDHLNAYVAAVNESYV